MATSLVPLSDVSISILSTVVSVYPHRSEAMCDAGALAVSKDTGPFPGYGRVVSPPHATTWDLGRISQEHGTLVHRPGGSPVEAEAGEIHVGELVQIVPQHACLACASFPWFYVVDEGDTTVRDVWVPWKGW
jgi:D-serine deaminase-like pyridoxal phosphate-dependent protein